MEKFSTIYCDFDGTISVEDSVNKFFALYANKEWLVVEDLWRAGEISSRECLSRQVALLENVSEETLEKYIASIEIDEYFTEFCNYVDSLGMKVVVLSDGFEMFIKRVLHRNGLENVEFYSNTLKYIDNKFTVDFNNFNQACSIGAGTCKCSKVKEKDFIYIGDGLSDLCVAKKATKLFAKGSLKNYCDKIGIGYVKFETFSDILENFQKGEVNATACSVNH